MNIYLGKSFFVQKKKPTIWIYLYGKSRGKVLLGHIKEIFLLFGYTNMDISEKKFLHVHFFFILFGYINVDIARTFFLCVCKKNNIWIH